MENLELKEMLRSILSQSLKNYEIVILYDASTDNIINMAKSCNDKKLKIFKNKDSLNCVDEVQTEQRKQFSFYGNQRSFNSYSKWNSEEVN